MKLPMAAVCSILAVYIYVAWHPEHLLLAGSICSVYSCHDIFSNTDAAAVLANKTVVYILCDKVNLRVSIQQGEQGRREGLGPQKTFQVKQICTFTAVTFLLSPRGKRLAHL